MLALFGPKRGVRIALHGSLLVGRAPEVELQLIDGRVSREHCRFELDEAEGLRVRDLGSQNGTYVNGQRIEAATVLSEGDEIAVGESLFLVAGPGLTIAGARYGDGTLLVHHDPAEDVPSQPGRSTCDRQFAQVLSRCAEKLLELDDEGSIVECALSAIVERFGADRAHLLLRPLVHGRLMVLGSRGSEELSVLSEELLDESWKRKMGSLLQLPRPSRKRDRQRSVLENSLCSVLLAPFVGPGRSPGMLVVDRSAQHPFHEADLNWLEALGHLLTVALRETASRTPAPAPGPIGRAPAFLAALRRAEAAARVDSTVLLLGETGTGKEEFARLIHQKSPRRDGPWVALNCGAIAESLAESELFGHEKGAFTGATATRLGAFEAADGGTLFLDEIGDLAPALQTKLLRVLQERAVTRVGSGVPHQVDVRVIAATHRDLEADATAGRFRHDLWFRINVVAIHLPPLRERRQDFPLLVPVLLERIAGRLKLNPPRLSDAALQQLAQHPFVGNIRELGNVLERLLVLRDPLTSEPLGIEEVRDALGISAFVAPPPGSDEPLQIPSGSRASSPSIPSELAETLAEAVARLERVRIAEALHVAHGKKAEAARILGISRPTLDKKLEQYQIDLWRESKPEAP